MLHDPKWDRGTLTGLITWLEGWNPSTKYNYDIGCDCLARRYMGHTPFDAWPQDV
jgi:hypothetical protein